MVVVVSCIVVVAVVVEVDVEVDVVVAQSLIHLGNSSHEL